MNYRDFFDKALSEAYGDPSFRDDEEFMKVVEERVERMKRQADENGYIRMAEVSPEYGGAKKHRAFNIAAGTAAAVAVIGGSALGLNYLHEYGGLREGGSAGVGAAFAEPTGTAVAATMPVPAGEEFVPPANSITDPEEFPDLSEAIGKRLEFHDADAYLKSYDYDGENLTAEFALLYNGDDYDNYSPEYLRVVIGYTLIDGKAEYFGFEQTDFSCTFTEVPEADSCTHTCSYTVPLHLEPGATYSASIEYFNPNHEGTQGIEADRQHYKYVYKPYLNFWLGDDEQDFISAFDYDDGSTVTVNSYSFDGTHLILEYSTTVPEGSDPGYDPLSLKSPVCRDAINGTGNVKESSENTTIHTYTFEIGTYSDTVDLYFLPDYSSTEEYEKVIAAQDRYKFTATVNTDRVMVPDEPADDSITEGEAAVAVLRQYAGEDYHYPVRSSYDMVMYYDVRDRFNLSSADAQPGDPVFAATGGTVVERVDEFEPDHGFGKYIVIQASDGRKWQYSHCSEIYAAVGDTVTAGDIIAAIGATGWCTGPCLAIDFPDSEAGEPVDQAVYGSDSLISAVNQGVTFSSDVDGVELLFRDYYFDKAVLKLHYDVFFPSGISADPEKSVYRITPAISHHDFSSEPVRVTAQTGNTLSFEAVYYFLDDPREITVMFDDTTMSGEDALPFVLKCGDAAETNSAVCSEPYEYKVNIDGKDTAELTQISLYPAAVIAEFRLYDANDEDTLMYLMGSAETRVLRRYGDAVKLKESTFQVKDGVVTVFTPLEEVTALSHIDSVYIGGHLAWDRNSPMGGLVPTTKITGE